MGKMMKKDIIYVAGIIDGEGCISILRTPRKSGWRNGCSYAVAVGKGFFLENRITFK